MQRVFSLCLTVWTVAAFGDCGPMRLGDACCLCVGACDGDEVVRLYFTVTGSGRQRPHRELLAFARVSLGAGESKRVALPFDRKLFGWYGRDGRYETPSGTVTLVVDGCERIVEMETGNIDRKEKRR